LKENIKPKIQLTANMATAVRIKTGGCGEAAGVRFSIRWEKDRKGMVKLITKNMRKFSIF
jgi:hypothetical protein